MSWSRVGSGAVVLLGVCLIYYSIRRSMVFNESAGIGVIPLFPILLGLPLIIGGLIAITMGGKIKLK